MTQPPERIGLPSRERLDEVFRLKYGDPATTGWGPRMRLRFGYFTPDDVYEGMIADLVTDGCAWLDVGCGRDIFPFNVPLAQQVAARCEVIVGVDPAPTLAENELVDVKVPCTIDEYEPDRQFDLLTLRMVARARRVSRAGRRGPREVQQARRPGWWSTPSTAGHRCHSRPR